jgi:hypothetical protein
VSGLALSDSKRRAKYGVEAVPHLGIRHSKRSMPGASGWWLIQYPSELARAKFQLPPNRPRVIGANQAKRDREERAHRRRFSGRDRVLPRSEEG